MKRRSWTPIVFAMMFCAQAACAGKGAPKTPSPPPPAAPAQPPMSSNTAADSRLFLRGIGGAGAVQKAGGLAGGEINYRLTERLAVVGEGVWMQDLVSRRRLDTAARIATFLQTTQGAGATGTVTAPGFYGGGGVRFMLLTKGKYRPYVTFTGGMARIALQPSFQLSGGDITANLPLYGVTLGTDLTGEVTKPAFAGTFGVRIPWGTTRFIDGEVGVINIMTSGQAIHAKRLSAGIGLKF
jgi:hypothetical protein